jgi:hypothetical protein
MAVFQFGVFPKAGFVKKPKNAAFNSMKFAYVEN